ncbi:RNA helicase Mov10l1-like isoform X2 [Watersipora subatra]|uniref:RNA helicase Mov10l1-like isoform X2 n=1 Tax=Watersipora subatra TaxID=2589382 RepID=UPI00355BA5D9
MSDDWDSIREVYQTSGAVTNMTGERSGTVDYKYNFIANHCQDYDPWKGDRVLVTLASNGYTEVVEALHPFAPQKYSGKVVHVGQRYCFIDGNIAFTRSCCVNRYTPCRGDLVSGQMIECDQGQRWGLRALTVSCNADQPDSTAMEGNSAQGDQLKKINAAYVFIEGNFEFNDVAVGSSDTHTFFIRNGSKNSLELNSLSLDDPVAAQFVISTPKILLEGHHANKALQSAAISLLPGMTACFHVTFRPRYVGRDSLTLLFHFFNLLLKRSIVGTSVAPAEGEKEVNVNRANQQIFRQVRHNISPSDSNGAVMPGTRPQFRASRLPKNLPQYPVPRVLRECVLNETRELRQLHPQLEHMSVLLFLEEINAEIELRMFDIPEAIFERKGGYLCLVVEGLSDGQPKLMVGDKLSAGVNSHIQDLAYDGYIHDIRSDMIYVKFHPSFHDSYNEDECSVIFHVSRSTFRRMHAAVNRVYEMNWPGLFSGNVFIKASCQEFVDSLEVCNDSWLVNKSLNQQQRLAVKRVMQAKCRPFPYIIFGPPGTGKTVTLVESVLQVFTNIRGSRILICTPSNSAADLLTVQLRKGYEWANNSIVRLISYSRQEESLPDEIRSLCRDGTDLQLVSEHRVIISTCSSAGMFLSLGLSTTHFSHVFIDEAGQASEPECLIPIALVAANPEASVVLAGDHKQLGAVIKSRIAEACGLTVSLLERTMSHPSYARKDSFRDTGYYDPNLVTKLVKNYRAHPFLLSLYSELFYNNELVMAAVGPAFSLENIKELTNAGKPIIFHGVQGEELRDGNNPSWFNAVEVVQIVKYLQAVLAYCQAEQIGVITPYRKQVEKIRQLMDCVGISRDVKVGSVEEFQGQERMAILVSTVRSRPDELDTLGRKSHESLGFLSNCKRFNVTISRAQGLLVVVGNPTVLGQDEYWKKLIDYSYMNGCYIGKPHKPVISTEGNELGGAMQQR